MPGLELKNISKSYQNGRKVIRDFSLVVEGGEFVILAGPEGCGKTTLLRMIAGLEEITSGTLLIDGEDMTHAEPRERKLAMLFQNGVLYPGMSVEENLTFALSMQRLSQSEIDERLKETVSLLSLESILSSMPDQLTKAETYWALLGRALIRRPEILLLDRAMSGAEEEFAGGMLKEFRQIHEQTGITVIYATDREDTVRMPGTRLVVMNEGMICQEGEPAEIYENPSCCFAACFVGRPPMNLLPASAALENGRVRLSLPGGSLLLLKEAGALLEQKGYIGKEIIMGIRPGDMRLLAERETEKDAGDGEIRGEFLETEDCGGRTYIRFQTGEYETVGLAGALLPENAGETVRFSMAADKVYLFDRETKEAIGAA